MDLAVGVAVGSSMQIALMVAPFIVLLGWMIDQPMTLYFNNFETAILFVTVLVVNVYSRSVLLIQFLIQDGRSNYLEGVLLMSVYILVSIAVYGLFVFTDLDGLHPIASSCYALTKSKIDVIGDGRIELLWDLKNRHRISIRD
jgi:Ca2+:H+ antiporter